MRMLRRPKTKQEFLITWTKIEQKILSLNLDWYETCGSCLRVVRQPKGKALTHRDPFKTDWRPWNPVRVAIMFFQCRSHLDGAEGSPFSSPPPLASVRGGLASLFNVVVCCGVQVFMFFPSLISDFPSFYFHVWHRTTEALRTHQAANRSNASSIRKTTDTN